MASGSSEPPSISLSSSGERTAKFKWKYMSFHHSRARWYFSVRDMPGSNLNLGRWISPRSMWSMMMLRMRSRFSSRSATIRGSIPEG